MKVRVSHPLPGVCVAVALAFAPLAASAQNAPMMGGGMKGGGQDHMMGGGMSSDEMMKGCDMMGGSMENMPHAMECMSHMMDRMSHMMSMMHEKMGSDMMGGPEHMSHMMSMMHEKASHAGERVASLKTELKITEAQTPAWNKFADALLAAAKSTDESMEGMHKQMMQSATTSLPEKLEHHAKMAAAHVANLNAIKAALDPLYASFSDEQKKLADGLKIGPMGVM
jgi:hypothetical protein